MTARELAGLLGRTGTLQAGGFTVRVRILDAKQAYGVDRACVYTFDPVCEAKGHGIACKPADVAKARWVNMDRLTLDSTEEEQA